MLEVCIMVIFVIAPIGAQVDGSGYSWQKWGEWSSCTVTCGDGSRLRHRACNTPPLPTGEVASPTDCTVHVGGQPEQIEDCNRQSCDGNDPGGDMVTIGPEIDPETDPETDTENTHPGTDTENTDPGTDTENTDPRTDTENTDQGTDTETSDRGTDTETTDPGTDTETTDPGTDTETIDPGTDTGDDKTITTASSGHGIIEFITSTASGVSFDETAGTVTLMARRINGANGDVSIDYITVGALAIEDTDYVGATGTIHFLDGETVKTIQITIKDDNEVEGDEDFYVELLNPKGGIQIDPAKTGILVTIVDDDVDSTPGSVDGAWGSWSSWSGCSEGLRSRSRICDDPPASPGGEFCALFGGEYGIQENVLQMCEADSVSGMNGISATDWCKDLLRDENDEGKVLEGRRNPSVGSPDHTCATICGSKLSLPAMVCIRSIRLYKNLAKKPKLWAKGNCNTEWANICCCANEEEKEKKKDPLGDFIIRDQSPTDWCEDLVKKEEIKEGKIVVGRMNVLPGRDCNVICGFKPPDMVCIRSIKVFEKLNGMTRHRQGFTPLRYIIRPPGECTTTLTNVCCCVKNAEKEKEKENEKEKKEEKPQKKELPMSLNGKLIVVPNEDSATALCEQYVPNKERRLPKGAVLVGMPNNVVPKGRTQPDCYYICLVEWEKTGRDMTCMDSITIYHNPAKLRQNKNAPPDVIVWNNKDDIIWANVCCCVMKAKKSEKDDEQGNEENEDEQGKDGGEKDGQNPSGQLIMPVPEDEKTATDLCNRIVGRAAAAFGLTVIGLPNHAVRTSHVPALTMDCHQVCLAERVCVTGRELGCLDSMIARRLRLFWPWWIWDFARVLQTCDSDWANVCCCVRSMTKEEWMKELERREEETWKEEEKRRRQEEEKRWREGEEKRPDFNERGIERVIEGLEDLTEKGNELLGDLAESLQDWIDELKPDQVMVATLEVDTNPGTDQDIHPIDPELTDQGAEQETDQDEDTGGCEYQKRGHRGHDIRRGVPSAAEECKAACIANPDCKGSTYDVNDKCWQHHTIEKDRFYDACNHCTLFLKKCTNIARSGADGLPKPPPPVLSTPQRVADYYCNTIRIVKEIKLQKGKFLAAVLKRLPASKADAKNVPSCDEVCESSELNGGKGELSCLYSLRIYPKPAQRKRLNMKPYHVKYYKSSKTKHAIACCCFKLHSPPGQS